MQLSPIIIASVTAICDNIPSGYVYRSDFNAYYKFNTKIDSWNNHAKSCRDDHHNSYLSSINSYAENQYVVANIASRAAIGARRRDITSDFEWLSNPSYIDFNNWRYNIDKDDHNCAAIYPRNSRRNGQWLNRPCEIADLIGVCKISCEEPEENDYYDYYSLFGPGNDLDLDQEARADFDYTETDCQPLDIEQSLTANDISIPTQMLTFFIDNSCQLRQKYNLSETDFAEKSFNFTRDISRHGCFGKKLDEMRSNPVTHGPIDKLDEIISDWVQCYSCTNKMMCHFDGSFSDESVKLHAFDDKVTCSGFSSECGQNFCSCGFKFFESMRNFLMSLDAFPEINQNAACDGEAKAVKLDSCCQDRETMKWKRFYSGVQRCGMNDCVDVCNTDTGNIEKIQLS